MGTIALDAVGIGETGGGRSATVNLMRELLRQDTTNAYLLLVDRPEPELLATGNHVRQVLLPVHHRMFCRGWAQIAWPITLRRQRVDLVHHTKNLTTLGLPGRKVVTIYDMTILLHPDIYPASDVYYWRHLQPHLLRGVDRVVAISQQTARDLVEFYHLPTDKIRVIYPAYNARFCPLPEEESTKLRARYTGGARFILHVGSISRKKNLLTLLRAYEKLCVWGYEGCLVLAGRQYSKGYDQAFHAHLARSPYRSRVILTGSVPDEDLPALYNAADLMVFPSLHEGFGLVPVEAMACGTPLITSGAGALSEVVGDGGLIIEDIQDAEAIARAADGLLTDKSKCADQVARGLNRAACYTANQAVAQTLALYRELLA